MLLKPWFLTVVFLMILNLHCSSQTKSPSNVESSQVEEEENLSSLAEDENPFNIAPEGVMVSNTATAEEIQKTPFDPASLPLHLMNQHRKIKLTNLNTEETKAINFFIDDKILFSGDGQDFQDVKLTIETVCNSHHQSRRFQQKTSIDYKSEIDLIEILPLEIFLDGDRWWEESEDRFPVCSFNFIAKNDFGDVHYFSFLSMAVVNFENGKGLNLMIKNSNEDVGLQELNQKSPLMELEEMGKFGLLKAHDVTIDELEFKCDTQPYYPALSELNFNENNQEILEPISVSQRVGDQQYYDLWAYQDNIKKALLSREGVMANHYHLACRFLGYQDQNLVASSQLFPLIFKKQSLPIKVQVVQGSQFELFQLEAEIIQHADDARRIIKDFHVLSLEFQNNNPYPVHLYFPENDMRSDVLSFYKGWVYPVKNPHVQKKYYPTLGFFTNSQKAIGFNLRDKEKNQKDKEEGFIITVGGNSKSSIPLYFSNFFDYCQDSQNKLVAFAFSSKPIPIYRVLNHQDLSLAQSTSTGLISWSQIERTDSKVDPFFLAGSVINEKYQNIISPKEDKAFDFFKNTCASSRNKRFASSSLPWSWKIRFKPKALSKYGKGIQSARKREQSIDQYMDRHFSGKKLSNIINKQMKEYERNRKLAEEEKKRQAEQKKLARQRAALYDRCGSYDPRFTSSYRTDFKTPCM